MPVVINEFEVLDTPQEGAQRETSAASSAPPLPDPEDLRRVIAQQAEAQLRLWAH